MKMTKKRKGKLLLLTKCWSFNKISDKLKFKILVTRRMWNIYFDINQKYGWLIRSLISLIRPLIVSPSYCYEYTKRAYIYLHVISKTFIFYTLFYIIYFLALKEDKKNWLWKVVKRGKIYPTLNVSEILRISGWRWFSYITQQV